MEAVSYANSAKQAQRIKKFINEPDSTSGIVTVPKVIASGETITIPAGRVAVLPNVQIDGVLNIENGGEVFIPSGARLSGVVEKVASTDNAIVRFNGTTGEVQDSSVLIDDNGNLLLTSGTGGLGYGAGSGGTVTQLTNKGTAVTLNKPCGVIIMNSASIAAGGIAGFQLINSSISQYDRVEVTIHTPAAGVYQTWVYSTAAGNCLIAIKNNALGALSDSVQLIFSIIKGANS